ncbi:MAG: NADPH:quinone oxidoreductase family protein [Acidimicrobiia bacterium]
MRALICESFDGLDALQVGELPEPTAGPGSVLIRVEAAGVNFADLLMVSGLYQLKPDLPFAPGFEVAGTVLDSPGDSSYSPGDRICGFLPYGGMAEKAVVLATNSAPLPEVVSFEAGAVVPGTYGTSYHALVDRARLQPGETVLVLGSAGGVGLTAVQVAKVLGGKVLAAVSSEEKARVVQEAGADTVIRYDQVPLREAIADATGGQGVDVVYDPVGGEVTEQALRSVRWGGRLLIIGFAAGDIPHIPLNLPLLKGNSLVGVFWGRFTTEEPERSAANMRTIVQWLEQGKLTPVIKGSFSLDEAKEAFRRLAERRAMGRLVVKP